MEWVKNYCVVVNLAAAWACGAVMVVLNLVKGIDFRDGNVVTNMVGHNVQHHIDAPLVACL